MLCFACMLSCWSWSNLSRKAVHTDGCQHKIVTEMLPFAPFEETRWGWSCSKQHKLITEGEHKVISKMELSLVPMLLFASACCAPVMSLPSVMYSTIDKSSEHLWKGTESEVCMVSVDMLLCTMLKSLPGAIRQTLAFEVCSLENRAVVLHRYELLPKQDKLDGFKALAKSKKLILTTPWSL